MKKFILKTLLILFVSILPNVIVGFLRLGVNDFIPYTINYDLFQARYARYLEDSLINKSETVRVKPVGDLNNLSFAGDPIIRSVDFFGFSNEYDNRRPEVLFIGDSFFNDPHLNSSMGIQSEVNKRLGKNSSYNIGNVSLCGFKVYNTLQQAFFTGKPKLIIFETVERNVVENIKRSLDELENHEKFSSFNHSFLDLILGNNFMNIQKSHLLHSTTPSKKLGKMRRISNQQYWFLSNKLHRLTPLEIEQTVQLMKEIQDRLLKEQVNILFVVAPDKESVYPELFGNTDLQLLQEKMRTEGVNNIDMFASLLGKGEKCYYRGDTHWSYSAVKMLADSVVKRFNQTSAISN